MSNIIDDNILVSRAKSGNAEALTILLEKYSEKIMQKSLTFKNLNGLESDDLYQEGMIGFVAAVYSFDEKPINLVDKVIFSFLSYVNFQEIVDYSKITIKEAGRIHLGMHKLDEVNIIAVKEANKLLRHIKDTKRYKDCFLYNYVYEGTEHLQFSAICIEYQKNKVYVSYEGTDQLISGWKEDIVLAYRTNTLSHKKAIKYLNKYFTFSNKQLIIGGHSKGNRRSCSVHDRRDSGSYGGCRCPARGHKA